MTLSADLAARTDDELAELLRARPDLLGARPPSSFGDLAGRLASSRTAGAVVDGLDAWERQVLEAIVFLEPGATGDGIAALLSAGHDVEPGEVARAVAPALDRLRALGLVWREGANSHAVEAVRHLFPRPFGLGPPARAALQARPRDELIAIARSLALLATPAKTATKAVLVELLVKAMGDGETMRRVLADAPEASRAIFDAALERGFHPLPYTYGMGSQRRSPEIDWLASRGLLVRSSYDHAVVPRDVAVAVRGQVVERFEMVRPELVAEGTHGVGAADAAGAARDAAAAARTIVGQVESLCLLWGEAPAPLLRTGGVGAREIKRAAKVLGTDEERAAFVIELADVAGLVRSHQDNALPTVSFDEWRAAPLSDRWTVLVDAWRAAMRHLSSAGRRGDDGKVVPALNESFAARWVVDQRDLVVAAVRDLAGAAPDVGALVRHVAWRRPALFPRQVAETMVRWVLAEAAALGLTTPAGAFVGASAEELLGGETSKLTMQADLTAMAAGPIDSEVAALLDVGAEVVSTGVATVWRFSDSSLRAALDAGWTAESILSTLDGAAAKGVPQPLAYLVSDIARRHGTIRVGAAASYVRSDDPAALASAVRIKGATKLGLRLIAPTVAVASAPVAKVLDALRAAGLAPAEETAEGEMVIRSRSPHRAPAPPPRPRATAPLRRPAAGASAADPAEVVKALRAAPPPASTAPPRQRPEATLDAAMRTIDRQFGMLHPPDDDDFDNFSFDDFDFDDVDFDDDDFDDDDFDDDDGELAKVFGEAMRAGLAVYVEWATGGSRARRQMVRILDLHDGGVWVRPVGNGPPFGIAYGDLLRVEVG